MAQHGERESAPLSGASHGAQSGTFFLRCLYATLLGDLPQELGSNANECTALRIIRKAEREGQESGSEKERG